MKTFVNTVLDTKMQFSFGEFCSKSQTALLNQDETFFKEHQKLVSKALKRIKEDNKYLNEMYSLGKKGDRAILSKVREDAKTWFDEFWKSAPDNNFFGVRMATTYLSPEMLFENDGVDLKVFTSAETLTEAVNLLKPYIYSKNYADLLRSTVFKTPLNKPLYETARDIVFEEFDGYEKHLSTIIRSICLDTTFKNKKICVDLLCHKNMIELLEDRLGEKGEKIIEKARVQLVLNMASRLNDAVNEENPDIQRVGKSKRKI